MTGFSGIESLGDDAYLWGNTVNGSAETGPDDGIVVDGNNPRIILNTVDGCGFDGVIVTGYTAGLVALQHGHRLRHRLHALGHAAQAPEQHERRATASACSSTTRPRSCAGTRRTTTAPRGS